MPCVADSAEVDVTSTATHNDTTTAAQRTAIDQSMGREKEEEKRDVPIIAANLGLQVGIAAQSQALFSFPKRAMDEPCLLDIEDILGSVSPPSSPHSVQPKDEKARLRAKRVHQTRRHHPTRPAPAHTAGKNKPAKPSRPKLEKVSSGVL